MSSNAPVFNDDIDLEQQLLNFYSPRTGTGMDEIHPSTASTLL